jgi:hypothetical protein
MYSGDQEPQEPVSLGIDTAGSSFIHATVDESLYYEKEFTE